MVSSELLYITLRSCGLTTPNKTSQHQDPQSHILERVDNASLSRSRPSTPIDIPLLDFDASPAAKLSSPNLPRLASPYIPLDADLPSEASSSGTFLDSSDIKEDGHGVDDGNINNGGQVVHDPVRPVYTFLRLRR